MCVTILFITANTVSAARRVARTRTACYDVKHTQQRCNHAAPPTCNYAHSTSYTVKLLVPILITREDMTLPKRRGYNLRRRSQDSHCILENSQETDPQQPAETTATSTTSPLAAGNASTCGYFSPGISLTPTGRLCPPQTRSSTWVATLRSLLFKQKPHRRPKVSCNNTVTHNHDINFLSSGYIKSKR